MDLGVAEWGVEEPWLTSFVALAVSILCVAAIIIWNYKGYTAPVREKLGVRIVIVSDTHNEHRQLTVPAGDILIHAGDYTKFGKREHAEDFNSWLSELPHPTKIVINGNHEYNSPWKKEVSTVVSNATHYLNQSSCTVQVSSGKELKVFGTEFMWPCKGANPYWQQIPEGVDVIITHGPVAGYVDGGKGCPAMLARVKQVRPRLVVSGHIHWAYGVANGTRHCTGTVFANGASKRGDQDDAPGLHSPIVIDL